MFFANEYFLDKFGAKNNNYHPVELKKNFDNTNDTQLNKSNIDYNNEFYKLKEVKLQILLKNLTNIETIAGGYGNVGNALIMLNNLINICINIKCKNIIIPGGLQNIIKKPIFHKDYNITIFPNLFHPKPKIDILLSASTTFFFSFRNITYKKRLHIIRDEVINNITKYLK